MIKKNSVFIQGLVGFENLRFDNISSLDFIKNKEEIFLHLVEEKLSQTIKMFEYKNFPDTFSPWAFEMGLQEHGFCFVWKGTPENPECKEGIYALRDIGYGGVLDDRFLPTKAVGSNPYLNITLNDEISGNNIVWAWNDSQFKGFSEVNSLYGGLLADAYITLRLKLVLHRAPAFATANNENEKADALQYFRDLDDGKLGVIGSKKSLEKALSGEGFSTKPNLGDGSNSLKEILEVIQFLNAQWNIRIGLNDNYNMKREALNSAETSVNESVLFPFIEDMVKYRKKAVEEINRKMGIHGEVDLTGEWKRLLESRNRSSKKPQEEVKPNELKEAE